MTLAGRKKVVCEDFAPPSRGQNGSIPKSNVRVVVRIRPENRLESESDSRVIVQYMNENVLVFDPKEQGSPEYGYRRRRRQRDIRRRQNKDLRFAFDYVFGPRSKNHEVYEQTTKQIVSSFLNGYNCSGKFNLVCNLTCINHNGYSVDRVLTPYVGGHGFKPH